ncbi:hypothetical protein VNO80_02291 [Phaseolus coccineus]|uniref:Uncharacterized protein n=1 Tax=Phaseolus coccineus TaxID=3886 RepID=A0AAN9NTZ5_PHACN
MKERKKIIDNDEDLLLPFIVYTSSPFFIFSMFSDFRGFHVKFAVVQAILSCSGSLFFSIYNLNFTAGRIYSTI